MLPQGLLERGGITKELLTWNQHAKIVDNCELEMPTGLRSASLVECVVWLSANKAKLQPGQRYKKTEAMFRTGNLSDKQSLEKRNKDKIFPVELIFDVIQQQSIKTAINEFPV